MAFAPLTWNADREDLPGGAARTLLGLKWRNYVRPNSRWESIEAMFRSQGGRFVLDRAPYSVDMPTRADGWATFESTNLYDIHTRSHKADAPVGVQKRYIAAPVAGTLVPDGVLFPAAFPAIAADRLVQPHENKLRDLIRFPAEPPGDGDVEVGLEIDFGTLPVVPGRNRAGGPAAVERDLSRDITLDAGLVFSDGGTFRGVTIKPPRVWDSAGRSARCLLRGRVIGTRFVGVKVVPRVFLRAATYPVFADTTSTFYPDANPEVSSVDGHVLRNEIAGASWTDIRAGDGTGADDSGANAAIYGIRSGIAGLWAYLYRALVNFDTSSIPDADVVSAAVLSLKPATGTIADNGNQSISIGPGTTASNTALADSDYQANTSATAYASNDITGMTADVYSDFTLDAAGRAAVSKTGITKYAVRLSGDVSNTEPSGVPDSGYAGIQIYSADQSGTTSDPKLVVTHDPATVPGGGFFSAPQRIPYRLIVPPEFASDPPPEVPVLPGTIAFANPQPAVRRDAAAQATGSGSGAGPTPPPSGGSGTGSACSISVGISIS